MSRLSTSLRGWEGIINQCSVFERVYNINWSEIQTSVACLQKKRWACAPLACTSSEGGEAQAVRSRWQLWPVSTGCRSCCQKWASCIVLPARITHTHRETLFLTCISADIRCIARGRSLRTASAHKQPRSSRRLLSQTLTLSNNFPECFLQLTQTAKLD